MPFYANQNPKVINRFSIYMHSYANLCIYANMYTNMHLKDEEYALGLICDYNFFIGDVKDIKTFKICE